MLSLKQCPAGTVLVCEIYHLFEHSGIYLGDGLIVELAGSGLVRAISSDRFLSNRSGEQLFALCDTKGRPIANYDGAQRAVAQIYSYQPYDVITHNCHQFVARCLTGKQHKVTSFFDLRSELGQFYRVGLTLNAVLS